MILFLLSTITNYQMSSVIGPTMGPSKLQTCKLQPPKIVILQTLIKTFLILNSYLQQTTKNKVLPQIT